MFNLPKKAQISKNIYKNAIYRNFPKELYGSKKELFDKDIRKITVVGEISEQSVNILPTEEIKSIFVVLVELKNKKFNENNIILISKLFGQNILLALNYQDEYKLAIFQTKLIQSNWDIEENINISFQGLNLDLVWENLVKLVGDIEVEDGNSLEDQIELNEKKKKLIRLIETTEKKARREIQSKKKFELFNKIKSYKKELEEL